MGLLAGCKKNPKEEIHGFEKWTLMRDAYMIFPDGTQVKQWRDEEEKTERFQLSDGTDLLQVSVITNFAPEKDVKGLTGITNMSEEAQKAVLSYYEEMGDVFDLDERLKIAYQDYLDSSDTGERFTTHTILQEVMPSAENDIYVSFLTALTMPKQDHFTGDTICCYDGKIFDREDGHIIELKELFQEEDWDQAQKELSLICADDDTTVSDEDIIGAIDQADILVFQDYLEVWFPYGTWERQEFDKGFGIKYDRLGEVLKDWAIPVEIKNE